MTKEMIRQMAAMAEDEAISAFSHLIADRPDDRVQLMRSLRADMPDLYIKWLDQASGMAGRRR